MVVHTCNPSPWEAEWEDLEFKVILGYIARPCLKNKTKQNKKKSGLSVKNNLHLISGNPRFFSFKFLIKKM
jgi:hypothetical protein